jgi:hypothetical protein
VIPESHRATVCNWYRVPMNLITCATLLAVKSPAVASDKRAVFAVCTAMLLAGVAVAQRSGLIDILLKIRFLLCCYALFSLIRRWSLESVRACCRGLSKNCFRSSL